MTLYVQSFRPGFSWIWGGVYKGLEIRYTRRRAVFLGWTHREWKRRGW